MRDKPGGSTNAARDFAERPNRVLATKPGNGSLPAFRDKGGIMEKRPLSLTIIAWLLIVLAVLGLVGVVTMRSNPAMMKTMEQMHTSIMFQQVWGVIGCVVSLLVAYGIFKAQPWSRVLYVVWGIIGLIVGFYTSPMKSYLVFSLVILVVVSIFLFSARANEYFSARGFMLKREA
jgi:magnesium-transporting ATPase (P-type)